MTSNPSNSGWPSVSGFSTYADEHEIKIRGLRIIYMVHEKVGHLGIFVSSSIAKILRLIAELRPLPDGIEIAGHGKRYDPLAP
jgi:Protein of unknown function (DUF3141)